MPDHVGNVDDLAAQAGMSRSGFQHLYKKLFGTTVIKDIIEGRTQRAKRLLSSTRLTIKEISARCGYTNGIQLLCGSSRNRSERPRQSTAAVYKENVYE